MAFERAWHQRSHAPVVDDPYARLLCGPLLGFAIRFRPLGWYVTRVGLQQIMPASVVVVARARYAEQALEKTVAAGIAQYVIIGAGMDSFAFRRPDRLNRIEAFEIDLAKEQRKKLDRIRRAGTARGCAAAPFHRR